MLSLFMMLFRKSYWQMLLRRGTWHEAWLSLRRAHKDRRARKHLGQVALLALAPALVLLYFLWLVGSGALILLVILIPIWGIQWWRARRRNEPVTSIVPSNLPTPRELTADERRELRKGFGRLTIFYAVMVDRAGTERFLKEKILPEGAEVVARRIYLDLLKREGLWDRMSRADRETMMMPEGHWDWRRINAISVGIEPLRLLRWILRLDFYLPHIGHQLRGDFRQAHELVSTPRIVYAGEEMATAEMLETGLDAARNYYVRCLAEEITRGYRTVDEEESADWAHELTSALAGKQHDDLVLGDKLVSEVAREELEWATLLAFKRFQFLNWALRMMKDGAMPADLPAVSPGLMEEQAESPSEIAD